MAEGQKILVIEDDHFLSSLIKGRLEKDAFTVRQAFDGDEAERLLKDFHPNLMILDLIMPRISGFEFLEKISIDPEFNQIPIIVLSNLGQEEDVQKAKNLGVAEYFIKARTSIDELVNAVKNYVSVPVR